MNRLEVWKDDLHVGWLENHRNQLQFSYSPEAVEQVGLNRPLVSIAMLTRPMPFGNKVTRPWFDGLLPEGEARRIIAYDLKLDDSDSFGLLAALGAECAGALSLLPPSLGAPAQTIPNPPSPLTDEDITIALRNLANFPLGVSAGHKYSLAGMQSKLLLTQLPNGKWAQPDRNMPSTHILKPANPYFPASAQNEAFCLRLAFELGLSAAPVALAKFGDIEVLVVERYDRLVTKSGVTKRLHQEDACQALGVNTSNPSTTGQRYEQNGGPNLRQIARILGQWGTPAQDWPALVGLTYLNTVIGNADAHAKNISLLHDTESHGVHLAPLYDLMSTCFYPEPGRALTINVDGVPHGSRSIDRIPGMYINNKRHLDQIDGRDLCAEAISWGMPKAAATQCVIELQDRLPAAIERATNQLPNTPQELVQLIADRSERILVPDLGSRLL